MTEPKPAYRIATRRKSSDLETALDLQMCGAELPVPQREYHFHPVRRWRFDFAWPALRLAVEVDGSTWTGGRHTRGGGFEADCEKYAEAILLGWRVLRFTGGMIQDGRALRYIEQAIQHGGVLAELENCRASCGQLEARMEALSHTPKKRI